MPFNAGDVLGRSFTIMSRNLMSFIVLGIILFLPVFVLAYVLRSTVETLAAARTAALVITGAMFLMCFVMGGTVCYGVFRDLSGDRASIGECLAVGFSRMVPVVVVSILTVLCVYAGLFLLLVPGFILASMLYVSVPASAVEAPGIFGALRRSAELTRGHRWPIFAIIMFASLLMYGGMRALTAVIDPTDPFAARILGLSVMFLLCLYWAVCAAVAYFHLRRDKEGIEIGDLVDVFR